MNWGDILLDRPWIKDIQWRELTAVFVMVLTQKEHWHGKRIRLFCDNMGVVWMLIRMRARLGRPDLQELIRQICEAAVEYRFHFWIDHVPGVDNVIADALSRNFHNPFASMPFLPGKAIPTATAVLQQASDDCKPYNIGHKFLDWANDDTTSTE